MSSTTLTLPPSISESLPSLSFSNVVAGLVAAYTIKRCVTAIQYHLRSDVGKLPTPPGASWLWGHEMLAFVRSCGDQYREWFDEVGTVYKIKAALGYGDILTTADAGIINHVLGKHVYDYEKSPMIRPVAERLVGHGLVWAEGDTHKRQRALITPAFTVENIRNMAPDISECTDRCITAIETLLLGMDGAQGFVDMQEWTAKLTLDVVGRVGFGHDYQLGSSPEAERILSGWHTQATMGFSPAAMFGMALLRLIPALSAAPVPALKAQEEIRDIIRNIARDISQEAKNNMTADGGWGSKVRGGKDLISLLLKAKVVDNGLSEDELLDNIVTFVVAGHETTSGTVNYTLHELSKNQDLQSRLRTELMNFKKENGGREPTFDEYSSGNKLPLLDAVMKEALRMYPAAPFTERIATRDDVIPLRTPVTTSDGKILTELRVQKGQIIAFPVIAINRIHSRWNGDGDTFRPERWLPENAHELPDKADLCSSGWNGSLTFSAGARRCIGYRLAMFEYKIILASLIRRFNFHDSNTKVEFRWVGSLQPRIVGQEDKGVQLPIRMSFVDEDDL